MDKTMADVADKAVDKITAGVEAVAKAVEKVAPHVWEVLVRQAFAEGVVSLVTAAVTILVVSIAARLAWKRRKSLDDDLWSPLLIPGGMIAAFGIVFAIMELRDGLLHVLTPEYYAATQLIEAAK